MIPVTKSFLPPIEEYISYIKRAYNNNWLTNRGELTQELEQKLNKRLELKETNIICMNNGTIPLQIALKILGNEGEIITTPFSYVATTTAIVWEKCKPVFVDIHPEYLTIDENKIEAAITKNTTCILATHVYGNPCNIEAIDAIAKKHNLRVIYDAAHCFETRYNGKSIFEYGDISTCSFHATKLFHTAEGGALFSGQIKYLEQAFLLHAFGHIGDKYYSVGINGKMSELQAAMGLSVLPYLDKIVSKRKEITEYYEHLLNGLSITKPNVRSGTTYNYAYFPLIFENETKLLEVMNALKAQEINPRRYFYPSLNTLKYLEKSNSCPISENISKRVLCLPLYPDLELSDVEIITEIIKKTIS